MTDTEIKETLERTRCTLARHLVDLMDEIEQADGRISSRKLLGGIHETVDTMSKLGPMMGNTESAVKTSANVSTEKVRV